MRRAEEELSLTIVDQLLVHYDGRTRTDQEFDTLAALLAHVQRVIELRQKQGYRVIAERKDDAIVMPPSAKEAAAAPAPPPPREGES